jgi:hypothetical protein
MDVDEIDIDFDNFGPLNEYNALRPDRVNPGGVFSNYNKDGTRRPKEEEEGDSTPDEVFLQFRKESIFKRRPRNSHKQIQYHDDGDGRFTLSPRCYILYNTPTDENGNEYIYINLIQCQQQETSGRILMNVFLHHYLKTRPIPPNTNVHIELTAVSNGGVQSKLNQYYKDIGFQQLDRRNNFKGNINDVLHFTDNYVKGANGLRKKTRLKTRIVSKRRMSPFNKKTNTNKKRKSRK